MNMKRCACLLIAAALGPLACAADPVPDGEASLPLLVANRADDIDPSDDAVVGAYESGELRLAPELADSLAAQGEGWVLRGEGWEQVIDLGDPALSVMQPISSESAFHLVLEGSDGVTTDVELRVGPPGDGSETLAPTRPLEPASCWATCYNSIQSTNFTDPCGSCGAGKTTYREHFRNCEQCSVLCFGHYYEHVLSCGPWGFTGFQWCDYC